MPLSHIVQLASESIAEDVFGFQTLEIQWISATVIAADFAGNDWLGGEDGGPLPITFGYYYYYEDGDRKISIVLFVN